MDITLNIITFIIFLGMCIISSKIILDSNFEKLFKQGRVASIRVAYFIVIFVVSCLVAFCFKELVSIIYNFLNY